jgi:hypothetical protein
MLPFPLVFLGKNSLQPVCLLLRCVLVHQCGVMKDYELLSATVTPKRAHFREGCRPLSRLSLLDRHCFH